MPSTSRGYPYPSGSDDVDIPGDMQALAAALNTDVGTVVTNAVQHSLADAAGDLVVGSAADTFGRLALGTDNYALTVNTAGSGVAKVGWEDPTANPLTVAAMALKVNTATVGNLLTANQATGTDTLTDTTGFALAGSTTLTSSTAESWQGSRSLKCAVTGAEVAGINIGVVGDTATMVPVTAGQTYTFSAYVRPSASAPLTYQIYWRTSDGSAASTTSGAALTAASGAWSRVLVTGVAPATAAYAILELYVVTPGAGHVYLDGLGFWEGAGGQWALPGTPITNLGFYTDESCGRRLFQYDANNSRWQMTYSDSGVRLLHTAGASLLNGWVAGPVHRISRIGNLVTYHAYLNGTGASTSVAYALPAGFVPESTIGVVATDASAARLVEITSNVTVVNYGATEYYLSATWRTSDAWPTSLPGSAVGSIPA